jgi:hypothetical protein
MRGRMRGRRGVRRRLLGPSRGTQPCSEVVKALQMIAARRKLNYCEPAGAVSLLLGGGAGVFLSPGWVRTQTGFSQTETWLPLSLVNGERRQSAQRALGASPANRAMRSSSEGQT